MTFETLKITFKSTHSSQSSLLIVRSGCPYISDFALHTFNLDYNNGINRIVLDTQLSHSLDICDFAIFEIRSMAELPSLRLIVILSLLGLASFSLGCTLTSRWSQFSHFHPEVQKYRCLSFEFLPAFITLSMNMIKIITIMDMISELQSLGTCFLEPCLFPCRRLPPTPSKVSSCVEYTITFFIVMLSCSHPCQK